MRPSDRDLVRHGPSPSGANNVARETSVPSKAVREARNVDLSDDGKFRRRRGYTLLEPLVGAGSLIGAGHRGFVLVGGDLMSFEVINKTVSNLVTIAEGLRPDARLASVLIEPDLFVSDGDQNLRIAPDNTVSAWSPPQAQAPQVTVQDGAMPPGRYQVALTAVLPSGEEGPLSLPWLAEATAPCQLKLVFPPAPAGATRYAIYMTKPNGTEFLLVGKVPVNASDATLASPRLGRSCPTEFAQQLPAADFALYYRSRLWVASGPYLTASLPFQYGLCAPDHDAMTFSEPITGLGAAGEAGGSFFVGQQSKVYLVRGDAPNELSLSEKYPAGMVAGTLTMVPGARLPLEAPPSEPVPMWLATNGVVCVGLPDGSVLPLTETRFAADVGDTGAGFFLQRSGESRYIATTAEPRENEFAIRDQVSFEIIRNGIPETI